MQFGISIGTTAGTSGGERGKRNVVVEGPPVVKATQQKQRRMIKNRESGATSRERKQKNGLARRIFSKAGVDNTRLLEATDNYIQRQPKVIGQSGGSMLGRDLEALMQRARDYNKEYAIIRSSVMKKVKNVGGIENSMNLKPLEDSCVFEDVFVSIPRGGPIYIADVVGPLISVSHFQPCIEDDLKDLKKELCLELTEQHRHEISYSFGVLDDDAKVTSPVGFQIAELPFDPMISKMIIASDQLGCSEEIIIVSAIL
ncbi:hypothetical protein L2E82_08458 [Cichorium intybus]|uniref:Uncharacterized protein n=1 Tax=Cichorium intybus TaxID=13427 RepID=A0ACB9G6G8_CICIN|nr:hypothetical protein L2E82_08458 [Cichorium intybus]